jgi:hypothetical protein
MDGEAYYILQRMVVLARKFSESVRVLDMLRTVGRTLRTLGKVGYTLHTQTPRGPG